MMFYKAIFLCVISLFSTNILFAANYGGGAGTQGDPYVIAEPNHIQLLSNTTGDWGKHFIMNADIDLVDYNEVNLNTIGNSIDHFTGVFDGNSHSISNLTLDTSQHYLALFGYVDDPNAVIKNVNLVDPNIQAGSGQSIGTLIGQIDDGTVDNCHVTGANVSGSERIGGLIGFSFVNVSNCSTVANVSGSWDVGGLIGQSDRGTVSNCFSSVNVRTSNNSAGGLVGVNIYTPVSNCYSTGTVNGQGAAGGLIGGNLNGSISYCYSNCAVKGTASYAGGLIGINMGSVTSCFAASNVTGDKEVGGLLGRSTDSRTIINCYSTGIVDGNDMTGGLIGRNYSEISFCYSTTEVLPVTASGAFIGYDESASYQSCFVNVDTNPGLSLIANTTDPNVIGVSTESMKKSSTFINAGWGLTSAWFIESEQSYPLLKMHSPADLDLDFKVDFKDFAVFVNDWLEQR